MKQITYRPELLEMLSSLTKINPSVIFSRIEDKVVVKMYNVDKSSSYILSAPIEYFSIEEDVGFYNFNEFYQFYKQFKVTPTLSMDRRTIFISADNSTSKYSLTDVEMFSSSVVPIEKYNNMVAMKEYEFEFQLDTVTLGELKKTMGLIIKNSKEGSIRMITDTEAKTIRLSVCNAAGLDDSISEDTGHSFETVLPIIIMNEETADDYTFEVISNHIGNLPNKDYNISVQGPRIKISMVTDNEITLDYFTGKKNR